MINGLYTASRSMSLNQRKQDTITQNLANSNTHGFKAARLLTRTEVAVSRNAEKLLHQDENQEMDEVKISFSQGPLVQTENAFDLALAGEGFFAVGTPDGPRYTRNGSMALNSEGELVTLSGYKVLDENDAPITLPGGKLSVGQDGGIFLDGKKVAALGMHAFAEPERLLNRGDSLFHNPDPDENPRTRAAAEVRQGFLEGSNVDTVSMMVQMIAQYRNYEADQKAIHAMDETLGKAVNEVGRVAA